MSDGKICGMICGRSIGGVACVLIVEFCEYFCYFVIVGLHLSVNLSSSKLHLFVNRSYSIPQDFVEKFN